MDTFPSLPFRGSPCPSTVCNLFMLLLSIFLSHSPHICLATKISCFIQIEFILLNFGIYIFWLLLFLTFQNFFKTWLGLLCTHFYIHSVLSSTVAAPAGPRKFSSATARSNVLSIVTSATKSVLFRIKSHFLLLAGNVSVRYSNRYTRFDGPLWSILITIFGMNKRFYAPWQGHWLDNDWYHSRRVCVCWSF